MEARNTSGKEGRKGSLQRVRWVWTAWCFFLINSVTLLLRAVFSSASFQGSRQIFISLHMGLHVYAGFDCVWCVSVWICAHEQVSTDIRGVWCPWSWDSGQSWAALHGCWESNRDLPQEQQALTADPPLQPLSYFPVSLAPHSLCCCSVRALLTEKSGSRRAGWLAGVLGLVFMYW